ncbi:hypothetical protein A2837_00580 [Candidatus Kaiserbacteria bacterium RIFCSPHIGHO2_01_FULL_46_22]|uniref:Uncharacterized protein n=1 Tax=Candidatus Kaiserbacteria bacterium RIFCSPHIGHO2_01_FULL_46_22 TaxID=1798475 RepID=A0A1F6BXS4_9BACT|nr:MAG: hypothetical protein A2837_00580 [Candidatus Kaiserbacteria bacterium RIFCSPHIGHO2_01_FULL_46_22]
MIIRRQYITKYKVSLALYLLGIRAVLHSDTASFLAAHISPPAKMQRGIDGSAALSLPADPFPKISPSTGFFVLLWYDAATSF